MALQTLRSEAAASRSRPAALARTSRSIRCRTGRIVRQGSRSTHTRNDDACRRVGANESCVSIPNRSACQFRPRLHALRHRQSILPAKAYRNIPPGKPDESLAEVVEVLDPRHPLYGRSFRVICRSSHRGGNFAPSYEVEHRGGTSLLVPISVTEPHQPSTNRTKLCIEALCELISAVECLQCDEHRSERSLGGAAAGSAATDRRRHRRGSGGDVS